MGNKSPIYSKIEYEDAVSSRKNVLEMQVNLLNTLKNIEEYKDLRKKELIWKIKMKSLLKDVHEKVKDIESKVPKSEELKEFENKKNIFKDNILKEIVTKEEKIELREETKSKEKKIKKESSIQSELEDIQRKLQEMS